MKDVAIKVPDKIKLGRKSWTVGIQIGGGGFARVFEARSGKVEAAIKFIPKAPGAEREMLFADLATVRNVVPVWEIGEAADCWLLLMPRATCSLRDQLDLGPVSKGDAVRALADVATALADLEGRVVHRDIKPQNVLLLGDTWCLADFGISRYAEAATGADTRKFAMTSAYAAPEQWRFERATGACDVYALGVIAYEMLDGRRPFSGPGTDDFRQQHLHEDPPALSGVGSALTAIVSECLFKAPSARPTPSNLLSRLSHLSATATTPGLLKLQEANGVAIDGIAERERNESIAATNKERRKDLFSAARQTFASIADELSESITRSASAAEVRGSTGSGWSIQLGAAKLALRTCELTDVDPWRRQAPAFEVIAHTSLTIEMPQNRYGYAGRSHSLWFCDALVENAFGWCEVAFMHNAISSAISNRDPFALDPGDEAGSALSPGMYQHQAAWPFTPLIIGDLDEFIDRWAGWLGMAATGILQHPSTMPERQPTTNWRR